MNKVTPLSLGGSPLHDVFLMEQLRQYNDYMLHNLENGSEIKLVFHIIDYQRG